jgi:hypothetical protein
MADHGNKAATPRQCVSMYGWIDRSAKGTPPIDTAGCGPGMPLPHGAAFLALLPSRASSRAVRSWAGSPSDLATKQKMVSSRLTKSTKWVYPINLKLEGTRMPDRNGTRRLTPYQAAWALTLLYEAAFGGKKRGRFRMSRSEFKKLSRRSALHDSFINDVDSEISQWEYRVFNANDFIFVMSETSLRALRRAPRHLIAQATAGALHEVDSLDEVEEGWVRTAANDVDEDEEAVDSGEEE